MDIILTSAVIVVAAYSTIVAATLAGFSSAARAQKVRTRQPKRYHSAPSWRSYDWLQDGSPHGTS